MYRFSVIVPILGEATDFDDTLASVLRHRPARTQIIVVHDGNYTDPYRLSDEIEFVVADGRFHLIRYFNRGLQNAEGQLVVLIRPGVQIDENWQIAVDDAFDDSRVGCVAPLIVNVNRPTRIVTAGVEHDRFNNRRLSAPETRMGPKNLATLSPLGPSSWLAVYRRDLLSAIGTLDERMDPHYMDLDIALALKQLGFKCELVPELVGDVESDLPIRREAAQPHGLSAQRAFRRFSHGANLVNTVLAFVFELFRSARQSWWLEHMFQRLAARNWADVDHKFADRLNAALPAQSRQQFATRAGKSPAISKRAA